MDLNTVTLPGGNGSNADATASFKSQVEKSKLTIQAETPPPASANYKGKWKPGGRGRRPKAFEQVSETAPPMQSVQSTQSVELGAPPDVTEHLIAPLMGISKIPAASYGVPELALTKDEAMLCAMSLNEVIKVFCPDVTQMDPRAAAILGLATTVGTIGFTKYSIYASSREKIVSQTPPPKDPSAPNTEGSHFPVEKPGAQVPAKDFFAKRVAV